MPLSFFLGGASDFLSTLHFVLNEDVERGTAVRARYSRKVAPVGVAKPRKRGKYYSRGLLYSCVSRLCDHGVAAF